MKMLRGRRRGGVESWYVRAYRQILARRGAASDFVDLYQSATPAGKVYALAGLYDTDRRTFERLVQNEFIGESGQLMYLQGCVGGPISAAEVREKLASGYFSRIWRSRSRDVAASSASASESSAFAVGYHSTINSMIVTASLVSFAARS